jgi:hypothetical protein
MSRRHLLRSAAGAAGLVLGANVWSARAADDCPEPKPITGGSDFLGNGTIFHVLAPGYPDSGADPATNNPSVITDLNGDIGLAYVRGAGTHTDKTTGATSYLPFEVDLRFMEGEYVGVDGKRHHGAFALVWLDVYQGPGGPQIHDFNLGISDSGLFWLACIDAHDVDVNPGNGRATMSVAHLKLKDYFDFVNSLLDGPSLPARASFRVEWTKSSDKHRFHDAPDKWDANVVFNSARVQWSAETAAARYVTDPCAPQDSLFAEVGHERSGVYFR